MILTSLGLNSGKLVDQEGVGKVPNLTLGGSGQETKEFWNQNQDPAQKSMKWKMMKIHKMNEIKAVNGFRTM